MKDIVLDGGLGGIPEKHRERVIKNLQDIVGPIDDSETFNGTTALYWHLVGVVASHCK